MGLGVVQSHVSVGSTYTTCVLVLKINRNVVVNLVYNVGFTEVVPTVGAERGERELMIEPLHCHHQSDFHITMC